MFETISINILTFRKCRLVSQLFRSPNVVKYNFCGMILLKKKKKNNFIYKNVVINKNYIFKYL